MNYQYQKGKKRGGFKSYLTTVKLKKHFFIVELLFTGRIQLLKQGLSLVQISCKEEVSDCYSILTRVPSPCRSTDSFTTLPWHLVGAGEHIFTNKSQMIFSIVYGKCRSRAKAIPQKNNKSVPESSTCFQRSRTLMADQITEAQMAILKMCRSGV